MKKGSYLINLARGPIVQNKDIIIPEKLLSNELEGYATDVWTKGTSPENDTLQIAWKNQDNFLKGRLIVDQHTTSYFSKEALLESRSKVCKTC